MIAEDNDGAVDDIADKALDISYPRAEQPS
jgi:hypothetical protein